MQPDGVDRWPDRVPRRSAREAGEMTVGPAGVAAVTLAFERRGWGVLPVGTRGRLRLTPPSGESRADDVAALGSALLLAARARWPPDGGAARGGREGGGRER